MCGHTDILGVGRLLDVAAVGHDDHGYDVGHADHQNDLYVVYVVGLHVDLLRCLCSRIFAFSFNIILTKSTQDSTHRFE